MVYLTLTKAKINSVSTLLTGDILSTETTAIPVAETNVFYDSSGQLITKGIVIGFDHADETYTEEIAIVGCSAETGPGNLTTITRGVKADTHETPIGIARAWVSGTKIAVMFTTGIYDQIRDNFTALDTGKAATDQKLDDFGAPDNNTDLNASSSVHGLLLKATVPAAGLRNVVAIDNAETAYKNAALFDATNPVMNSTGAPGSAMVAARRDHVHDSDTSRAPIASPTFTGTPNITTTPAAGDNSHKIADTAFVLANGGGNASGILTYMGL